MRHARPTRPAPGHVPAAPTPAGGALLLLWSLAPRRSSSSDPFKGNLQDPQDFGGFLRKPLPLPDAPKKKKYDSTVSGDARLQVQPVTGL